MRDFLTWVVQFLFRDNRGEVGDDPPDDDPDKEKDQKKDEDEEEEDEDLDELFIDLDEKEEEEDKEAKEKADKAKAKESEKETKKLQSELETLKEKEKTWKRTEFQARKEREVKAGLETDKDAKPLTDAQLATLLETADKEGDTHVTLNVLKYLAERVSEGKVTKAVNAAEMSRKADDFTKVLTEKFPDIANPTSDMRADIDRTKDELGIVDHPYGDMFAVGFNLFKDMDELIEAAYEGGKEDVLKGTADEKRKKEIKAKALPISKKSPKHIEGLKQSYIETATQMNLTEGQMKYYKKLAGKAPKTVSVEG